MSDRLASRSRLRYPHRVAERFDAHPVDVTAAGSAAATILGEEHPNAAGTAHLAEAIIDRLAILDA